MHQIVVTRTFTLCICLIALSCLGQAAPHPMPPISSSFSGCVNSGVTDKNTIILSGESVCAKLTGNFSAEKLIGHQVDLKGVLTERTPTTPANIHVESIHSIGKSCSNTCSLQPPGTRGLEKPGKEGGTPGMAPKTPPQ